MNTAAIIGLSYTTMGTIQMWNSMYFYMDHDLVRKWKLPKSLDVPAHFLFGIGCGVAWPISIPALVYFEKKWQNKHD